MGHTWQPRLVRKVRTEWKTSTSNKVWNRFEQNPGETDLANSHEQHLEDGSAENMDLGPDPLMQPLDLDSLQDDDDGIRYVEVTKTI